MRILAILLCAVLQGCGGGEAATVPRLAFFGDSLTLRTGLCPKDSTPQACRDQVSSMSYATHLARSRGAEIVALEGRGGDTCTAQGVIAGGPFDGVPRGILGRVKNTGADATYILAGINDVSFYGVSPADAAACVAQAASRIAGRVVILTYPPVTNPSFPADKVAALNAELVKVGAVSLTTWPDWAVQYMTSDGVHPNPAGAVVLGLAVGGAGSQPE